MAADNDNNLVLTVSSDMSAAERGIRKFVGDIANTSSQVEKQFQKMGRGIDNSMVSALQTRIDKMVGVGVSGAKEWTGALADQGKELGRLRARYSPLFATISNYKTAVTDIKRAHALGAISATEMTAAITKERQAALASTAAIKGRNQALANTPSVRTQASGGSGGNGYTANIAAQFQDIGVSAAGGMSPLQIALQQGTQLSAVFNDLNRGGKSLGSALSSAFLSVISPMSLVTIGLVAGTAALIQYFTSAEEGTGKTSKLFQEQNDIIRKAADLWGDATPNLRAYVDELDRADKITSGKQAGEILAGRELEGLSKNLDDIKREGIDAFRALRGDPNNAEVVRDLRTAWGDLKERLDDGTASIADVNNVQNELARALSTSGSPEVLKFKEAFDQVTKAIYLGVKAAQEARTAYIAALAGGTNVQDIVAGSSFTDNGKTYRPSQFQPANAPTPGARPKIELEGMPGAQKAAKAEETAAQKSANAYRDLIKSADDRIGQLKLENDLLGQYGAATDAARFRLDLLQQSEDKGRGLSEKQRAEIEEKVAAYSRYSEALAEAKLQQDLLDSASMRGLSPQEQKVKQALRQYGLPEDLGGKNASSIRNQLQMDEITSASDAFIDSLSGALLSGGEDIGKKLGQVVLNALLDSAQKQISNILKQLFSSFMSGTSPAGGAASGAASLLTAPVTSVTRSALPDVKATTDIAKYISSAATARGIDPSIALRVAQSEGGLKSWNMQSTFMKNGVQEPSFGPYQLYMGGGLGNAFQKKTGLDPRMAANGPAGVDFALDNAKTSGWGAWYGAKKAGIGNWDGIGKGGSNAAADAVNKLADSAGSATIGLDKMGGGLNKLTQSMSSSFFPATPSAPGGGGGGWFSSLFSGGGGANLSKYKNMTGLFSEGGFTGAGGKMTPAGIVHKGEYVMDAKTVSRLGIGTLDKLRGYASGGMVGAPIAPSLVRGSKAGGGGSTPGILIVRIDGANGDEHVRMLAKQAVGEGLGQYNKSQERGGFGTLQAKYNSQKG